MLATTSKTAPVVVPMTLAQLLEALLEHTGDLDKALVLQASVPQWLATADLNGVQALKAGFEQSFAAQGKVTEALKKLKPLDEFCKEQLTGFLKGKWTIDFDVERDTLDITKKSTPQQVCFRSLEPRREKRPPHAACSRRPWKTSPPGKRGAAVFRTR